MIINHNMASLNTYNRLSANNASTSKSLEKLSSGLRINRAGDDAAGLAISEKMRGQIRGLDQAGRNAQDGISMIQTAEGALNETHSILQRMRELAVQSASDTNTASDRTNLQSEVDALNTEIDRIANTTEFNTKKLLNGTMGAAVNTAVANVNTNTGLKNIASTATLLTALQDSNGGTLGIAAGDTVTVQFTVNGTMTSANVAVTATTTIGDLAQAGVTLNTSGTTTITATASATGFAGAVHGLTISVKDSSGASRTSATNALSGFTETTAAATVQADGRATIQIGANANQNVQISISQVDATALGTANLKISTQSQANVAISVIDSAMSTVSTQRGNMGALQNRLEHTINNLSTSSENLTAAESRVRDVDMAKEMMSFQKNNILSQAATAMLAQANQQPQGVLQLLR